MEKSLRGIILQGSPIVLVRQSGTINSVFVKPVIIVNIPALYELALSTNTDPAAVTVANTKAADAEKSLKDLYDEGVIEIEIDDSSPLKLIYTESDSPIS